MTADTAEMRNNVQVLVAISVCGAAVERCIWSAIRQTLRGVEVPLANDASAAPDATVAEELAAGKPSMNVLQLLVHGGKQAWAQPVDGAVVVPVSASPGHRRRRRFPLHAVLARHDRPAGTVLNRGRAELAFSGPAFDSVNQARLTRRGATVAAPGPNPGVQAGGYGPALRPFPGEHSAGYKVHI